MPKIDLSGNTGWQGNAKKKIESLEVEQHKQLKITIDPENPDFSWTTKGKIAKIISGSIKLGKDENEMIYEKNDMIHLDFLINSGLELSLSETTVLILFQEM